MALGAIGTLGAIGSGISKAMPSIIEEREKELNANFVTEFHRISTSGTEEEMTQLLEDPRYSNVSPQVRQRIGKALEGGVLRKEDEEKYKKILPTITDDRGTSDSKIRGLRGALERDIEILEAVFGTYSGHYETFQGNKELVSLAMSQIYADHGLVFGYARGQSFADDYLQKGSAGLGVYPAEVPGYQEQGEALPSGPPSWERGPGYR